MKNFKFLKGKSLFTFTTGRFRGRSIDDVNDTYLMWFYWFQKNSLTSDEKALFETKLTSAGYTLR